jgi:hypothetical protein
MQTGHPGQTGPPALEPATSESRQGGLSKLGRSRGKLNTTSFYRTILATLALVLNLGDHVHKP